MFRFACLVAFALTTVACGVDASNTTVSGIVPSPVPTVETEPTVYDKVIVKSDIGDGAKLCDTLESYTGMQTRSIRFSFGSWWVVTFEPVNPARNQAAQDALVESVRKVPGVIAADGDHIDVIK